MAKPVRIKINNKKVSKKDRAINRGVTPEDIVRKAAEVGYDNIEDYEQEFYKEAVAKKKGKEDINSKDILAVFRQDRIQFFKAMCEEKILGGFQASNGHFYRTNRDDQTNMIDQKNNMPDVPEELIAFPTEDAGEVAHTQAEWLQVYAEAFAHRKAQLARYAAVKRELKDATSRAKISAVTW